MRILSLRRLGNWIVGMLVGTLIIALTSPLFVRSYLPLQIDPVRGVWTLPPQHTYRWRSEGYANTFIGPLGMPGRRTLPPGDPRSLRIALWGDSQAEGVCVTDDLKLHAQIERDSGGTCSVFPLARSGEDAAVWLTQMPQVERQLGVDAHLILVVDLPDLLSAPMAPVRPIPGDRARTSIAASLPAFVIQSARNLLREADQQTPRKLRFSVGPPARLGEGVGSDEDIVSQRAEDSNDPWREAIDAIRAATKLPVVIVYAPHAPQIVSGRAQLTNTAESDSVAMQAAATTRGLTVIDMSDPFRDAVKAGIWPRGFHNGYIGSGHLNSDGYQIIARRVAEAIEPLAESAAGQGN
jgi:hypothetical protein